MDQDSATPEASAFVGLLIGLIGVTGSALWYFGNDGVGSGLAAALGIISLVVLIWSALMTFFLIKASHEDS